jgi:hypothetical protein
MPIYTTIQLGVSARLALDYKNIHVIKKLFNIGKPVFIYRISSTPIDYYEKPECFDKGILDALSEINSEEEFNIKSLEIAELRNDRYVTCLRRKIQYSDEDTYKNFIHDDDDYDYTNEQSYSTDKEIHDNYEPCDVDSDITFSEDEDEDEDDEISINKKDSNVIQSYDETKNIETLEVIRIDSLSKQNKQSKYKDFALDNLVFDVFYQFSDMYGKFDNDDNSYKTSYEIVSYSTKNYLDNLHGAIHFFKEMGIDEEKLVISNYNTCQLE